MTLINEIIECIIAKAKNGDTIRQLAKRTKFAYSAVYRGVKTLEAYNVVYLINKGNKTIIKINNNKIYKKFLELHKEIDIIEKDKIFWELIKKSKLKVRFIKGTAAVIWTQGGYITGDFIERIYNLEVDEKDFVKLKDILKKYNISCSENDISKKRPFICITKGKNFKFGKKDNLPIMPLTELIKWCKDLYLDKILEELSSLYNLNLKTKYSEILTSI